MKQLQDQIKTEKEKTKCEKKRPQIIRKLNIDAISIEEEVTEI